MELDEVDKRILELLAANARATVKDIAKQVSLTSPAVSERIRRMEKKGIIEGYTVKVNPDLTRGNIQAFISIAVEPAERGEFYELLRAQPAVQECYQVTGSLTHMVKVSCRDIEALEKLISRLQKLGRTNTQIILSAMHKDGPVL